MRDYQQRLYRILLIMIVAATLIRILQIAIAAAMFFLMPLANGTTKQEQVPAIYGQHESEAEKSPESTSVSQQSDESIAERPTTELTSTQAPLPNLVTFTTGIKNFSVVAGMNPDVMAGIQWDEDKIMSVSADTAKCNFSLPGTYEITYTIVGAQGTETVPVTVTVREDLEQYLYGMEGSVYIPVGSVFDPMENVVYDSEIKSIEPDISGLDTSKEGEYLISYQLTSADGELEQTAIRRIHVGNEPAAGVQQALPDTGEYSTVTDLGLWRLTAYMDTPEDQGPYVGQTASGAPLVAGRTVAVSQATCARLGLVFGDRLMIDGHIYVLEDHGGSAMYNSDWVDIYVDNPEDEYSERYNRYSEVYLLR